MKNLFDLFPFDNTESGKTASGKGAFFGTTVPHTPSLG